jgi:hypothetical protein
LKAEEDGFHRQAAFGNSDADVGRIITSHVFALGADNDSHNQGQVIDGVDREN